MLDKQVVEELGGRFQAGDQEMIAGARARRPMSAIACTSSRSAIFGSFAMSYCSRPQRVRECRRERGQQHARVRMGMGKMHRSVQRHDGLAGSGGS